MQKRMQVANYDWIMIKRAVCSTVGRFLCKCDQCQKMLTAKTAWETHMKSKHLPFGKVWLQIGLECILSNLYLAPTASGSWRSSNVLKKYFLSTHPRNWGCIKLDKIWNDMGLKGSKLKCTFSAPIYYFPKN